MNNNEKIPEDEWQQYECCLLKERNPIPFFDSHIDFDSKAHVYYLDGVQLDGSSTGFIHSFFGHFDADEAIQKMRGSKNWNAAHKYFRFTDEQIKKMWEDNRVDASSRGTRMHLLLEWFYNDLVTRSQIEMLINENNAQDLQQFMHFYDTVVVKNGWVPFRTELRAYSRIHGLAGSVDMIFVKKDGSLVIVDWKRSREIKKSNFFQSGTGPCAHLAACNYVYYSLQLNLYKWFMQTYTSYRVSELFIAVFHPNQDDFALLKVTDMQREIEAMLAVRLQQQEERDQKQLLLAYEYLASAMVRRVPLGYATQNKEPVSCDFLLDQVATLVDVKLSKRVGRLLVRAKHVWEQDEDENELAALFGGGE